MTEMSQQEMTEMSQKKNRAPEQWYHKRFEPRGKT